MGLSPCVWVHVSAWCLFCSEFKNRLVLFWSARGLVPAAPLGVALEALCILNCMYSFVYLVCVHARLPRCAVCVRVDSLRESIFSSHRVDPGDPTCVFKRVSKRLYSQSQLAGPFGSSFKS